MSQVILPAGSWNSPGADAFTIVVDTTKTGVGSSNSNQYRLPFIATGNYRCVIDWGDGEKTVLYSYDENKTIHTYAVAGTYTIVVSGKCWGWEQVNVGDKLKLIEVNRFGKDFRFASSEGHFHGCANLTKIDAEDIPYLRDVTGCQSMFSGCASLVEITKIAEWDFSSVTSSVASMFRDCVLWNYPMPNMKFGTAWNYFLMFGNCTNFNQDISSWDVSSGTQFGYMFYECANFNQPLNNWNMSNATYIYFMFWRSRQFNQPLNDWDVSNVISMDYLFAESAFNQPLSSWNTSKLTSTARMFSNNTVFNQSLNMWNTDSLQSIQEMFLNCSAYNQPLNNWNTSNINNMSYAFYGASAFNQDISNWDVSKVTTVSNMFTNASSFNTPLNTWNVENVTDFSRMFYAATAFNQPLNNWNTAKATNMSYMFYCAYSFNQDIGDWNVAACTTFANMFDSAYSFDNGGSDNINNWNLTSAQIMTAMFKAAYMFNRNISSWNVENVTTFTEVFRGAVSFKQDLSAWSPIRAVTLSNAFNDTDINTPATTKNLDNLFRSWSQKAVPNSLSTSFGLTRYGYFGNGDATIGRTKLVTAVPAGYGWSITSGSTCVCTFSNASGKLLVTYTGDRPSYTRVVFQTSDILPSGLLTNTDYWLVRVSGTTARIATSKANALANITIDYTDSGSGVHDCVPYGFSPSAITNNVGNLRLSLAIGYTILSGTKVRFVSSGVFPTGLQPDTDYYLRRLSTVTFHVSTSVLGAIKDFDLIPFVDGPDGLEFYFAPFPHHLGAMDFSDVENSGLIPLI